MSSVTVKRLFLESRSNRKSFASPGTQTHNLLIRVFWPINNLTSFKIRFRPPESDVRHADPQELEAPRHFRSSGRSETETRTHRIIIRRSEHLHQVAQVRARRQEVVDRVSPEQPEPLDQKSGHESVGLHLPMRSLQRHHRRQSQQRRRRRLQENVDRLQRRRVVVPVRQLPVRSDAGLWSTKI